MFACELKVKTDRHVANSVYTDYTQRSAAPDLIYAVCSVMSVRILSVNTV